MLTTVSDETGFTPQALKTLCESKSWTEPNHEDTVTTVEEDPKTNEDDETMERDEESDEERGQDIPVRRIQRASRPPNRLTYNYLGQPSIRPCLTVVVQNLNVTPMYWWLSPMLPWNISPCGYLQPWPYGQLGNVY